MTETFKPQTLAQLRDTILWAVADKVPLEVIGSGSKRALGHAVQANHVLDTSGLAGVLTYEPEELVITLRAGTPLADVEALLRDSGQMLPFEPIDWGPVLGGVSNPGTIGGAMMVSSNGPRRLKSGAARDHLLGLSAVSGRGEEFRAGGKVVKNVTGYDLSKLMTGSWGTLAVLDELTLKVLPAPAKSGPACRCIRTFPRRASVVLAGHVALPQLLRRGSRSRGVGQCPDARHRILHHECLRSGAPERRAG